MAVAFTQLAAILTNTSNTTSYTALAGTPASGDLLLCFVCASGTVAGGAISGGGWTWNKLTSFTFNGGVDTIYVFWARATAATSTACIFTCTGDAATGCLLYTLRVTGQDAGGAPYIRQIKTATGSTTNPAVNMDFAILTGNGVVGVACNKTNSSTQRSAPASWSENAESTFSTPSTSMQVSSIASGETGSTITWTNANTTNWGILVMEIYVSGAGITEDGSGGTGYSGGASNV